MRGLKQKSVALLAVAAMALGSLTGCAASVDNSEVVATVGVSKITAGVANFFVRQQQVSVESMFSMYGMEDKSWKMDIGEGKTYEESVKDGVMESLQELYILKNHMADYKVELTKDEEAAIEAAADAFLKANTKEVLEKVSGEKDIIVEVLQLMTIQKKMYDAIVADVDTEVSDKEAAQKAMQYMFYATTSTDQTTGASIPLSDTEKEAKKTEAETFLAKAKENGDLEAYAKEAGTESKKATFDAKSTSPDEAVIKAADALKKGEFSEVIETESGYYVLQVTSLLDREATDTKKESIVTERQDAKYTEVFEALKEETKISVDEKLWKKISLYGLKVTEKQVEEEKQETTE